MYEHVRKHLCILFMFDRDQHIYGFKSYPQNNTKILILHILYEDDVEEEVKRGYKN